MAVEDVPAPFFIIGFQRSGTTLLRVMLDAHPEVAVPLDAVGLWDRYEQRLGKYDDLKTAEGRSRIVEDLLAEERIRLWKVPLTSEDVQARWTGNSYPGLINAFCRAYAASRGKRRWGDKDPGNMVRMDQVHRWFPEARFIHIIRDGRDACLSQLEQDFGFDNLLDCACAWREEVQWVRRIGKVLGSGLYFEIRYEDLIADPAGKLKDICCFLDLEYSDAMLNYHQSIQNAVPEEKRHVWKLIDKPPVTDNAGRWKNSFSAGQRICFEKRAGMVLRDMGYDVLPRASGAYLEEGRNLASSLWRSLLRRVHKR